MIELTIFANESSELQRSHALMVAKGAKKHGVKVEISGGGGSRAKNVVCWGWRRGKQLRKRGYNVLVMERGYLGDRFQWTSLGWNGLNGRANFNLPFSVDGQRWKKLFEPTAKPWKDSGDYILIMGQVPGDMSLDGAMINTWYMQAFQTLKERFDCPVYLRPHPVAITRKLWRKVHGIPEKNGDLNRALSEAKAVVTYNSNSGTDAVMAGVPVIMQDLGGMAWPVSAQGLEAEIITPDRTFWGSRLAWCQWTDEELENGFAWDFVGRGMV
jgi:hypothetical protein